MEIKMISKEITSTPINPFDQQAVSVIAYDINVDDNAVTCRLVDSDGKVIENKRVYRLDDMPFPLDDGEEDYLNGGEPKQEWKKDTIKLWMETRQEKDEEGNVDKSDPLYYTKSETADSLLEKVNAFLNPPEASDE